ncbi:MAG: hypothetical protein U1F35_08100 [Steroidobacteraceae bacterium]
MTEPTDEEPKADTWSGASGGRQSDTEVTRTQFRSRARALFRRYIAATEMGRLPDHQQAFIDRNEKRSPAGRYWLLVLLERREREITSGIEDPAAAGLDLFAAEDLTRVEAEYEAEAARRSAADLGGSPAS